ncbi:MAG: hypothetical protein U9O94_06340 [Nanoarchaeota archaeon]|nr:hypothetical protein [Nanoarchaeota archaeon]
MNITINIDIEAIVTQEIRRLVQESVKLVNTAGKTTVQLTDNNSSTDALSVGLSTLKKEADSIEPELSAVEDTSPIVEESLPKQKEPSVQANNPEYDYAPLPNKRRNKTQIALHERELEFQRKLTPEEVGTYTAQLEMLEKTTEQARVDATNKLKAENTANKLLENVNKEETDHTLKSSDLFPDVPAEPEAEVEPDSLEDVLSNREERVPEVSNLDMVKNLFEN